VLHPIPEIEYHASWSRDEAKELSKELSVLSRQQYEALQKASYSTCHKKTQMSTTGGDFATERAPKAHVEHFSIGSTNSSQLFRKSPLSLLPYRPQKIPHRGDGGQYQSAF
jgi:hypothetical protein